MKNLRCNFRKVIYSKAFCFCPSVNTNAANREFLKAATLQVLSAETQVGNRLPRSSDDSQGLFGRFLGVFLRPTRVKQKNLNLFLADIHQHPYCRP